VRTEPLEFVCHQVAHPHAGGAAAYLKSRGWANKLEAEPMREMAAAAAIVVQVTLTEAGAEKVRDVVAVLMCRFSNKLTRIVTSASVLSFMGI